MTIDEAIDEILASWEDWEGEAGQEAQIYQDGGAYIDHMRRRLRGVLGLVVAQEQHQRDVYQKAAAIAPNYIADREQMPETIWLACGRKIEIEYSDLKSKVEEGRAYLEISSELHPAFGG